MNELNFVVKDSRVNERRYVSFFEPMNDRELAQIFLNIIREYGIADSYMGHAATMGVLEGVKQFYYRQYVVPYEEQKKFDEATGRE